MNENIFCIFAGAVTHGTLKDPDYFTDCFFEADPYDRFLCMAAATATELAECSPLEQCP